ncbi:MAG: 30S ribosomal protein S27e [Promethearchaeota archaeon]
MINNKDTKSVFFQVRCECGHEQTIFSHAASQVKCLSCEKILAYPTGGKVKITCEFIQVLG